MYFHPYTAINSSSGGSSGGDVWEEVDRNNWPTDWVEYERIRTNLSSSAYSDTASWSNSITDPSVSADVGSINEIDVHIGRQYITSVGASWGTKYMYIGFVEVTDISKWQSSSNEYILWAYAYVFNGAGFKLGGYGLTKEDFKSNSSIKIWRLKK